MYQGTTDDLVRVTGEDVLRELAADRDEALYAARLASADYLWEKGSRDGDWMFGVYLVTEGQSQLCPPIISDRE